MRAGQYQGETPRRTYLDEVRAGVLIVLFKDIIDLISGVGPPGLVGHLEDKLEGGHSFFPI